MTPQWQQLSQAGKRLYDKFQADSIAATLIRGASASFSIRVVSTGLQFGLHLLLARILGVAQYGIYIYCLTWISIWTLLTNLGWDTTLVRFLSTYQAELAFGKIQGLWRISHQFVLSSSILLWGLVSLILWGIQIPSDLKLTLGIGLLCLPFLGFTTLRQAALRALGKIALAQLPEDILRPVVLLFLVIGTARIVPSSMTASFTMILYGIAIAIAFCVGTYFLNLHFPASVKTAIPEYETPQWLKVSLPLALTAGVSLILGQTDTVMLGWLKGTTETGIYGVANRLAGLTTFGLVAVNAIAAPTYARLYAQKNHQALQHCLKLSARGVCTYAALVGLVLISAGPWILSWFGPEFVAAYPPLVVLVLGQLVNASTGSVGVLLTMTGYQTDVAKVIAIGAMINVVLNSILIPGSGVVGAAIATAISTVFWNICFFTLVWKRLRLISLPI